MQSLFQKGRKGKMSRVADGGAIQKPGDPKKPNTFINIDGCEQKLSAYLGFSKLRHLRCFLVSEPCLRALRSFLPIAHRMNKVLTFILIDAKKADYTNVGDYATKWKLDVTDDMTLKQHKARHLACVLVDMEAGIRETFGESLTKDELSARIEEERKKKIGEHVLHGHSGEKVFSSLQVPPMELSLDVEHSPVLGPYVRWNESYMEAINRCWNVLRYLRYLVQAKIFNQRLSEGGLHETTIVHISHVPHWMRPPRVLPTLGSLPEVEWADALPEKDFPIKWPRSEEFPGEDKMDEAIKNAIERGTAEPKNLNRSLDFEPRVMDSFAQFRNGISQLYLANYLGIDLRSIRAKYTPPCSMDEIDCDAMTGNWKALHALFMNDAIPKIELTVMFQATDRPGESPFEAGLSPVLATFFKITATGQIVRNDEALKRRYDILFGDAEVKKRVKVQEGDAVSLDDSAPAMGKGEDASPKNGAEDGKRD